MEIAVYLVTRQRTGALEWNALRHRTDPVHRCKLQMMPPKQLRLAPGTTTLEAKESVEIKNLFHNSRTLKFLVLVCREG